MALLSILSFPNLLLAAVHSPRRRRIWVERGKIIERTEAWLHIGGFGVRSNALALKPAVWAPVRLSIEAPTYLVWARPLLQVIGSRKRDPSACGSNPILCGYSDAYRRLWTGYFTLRGLRRARDPFPVSCVMFGPPIGGMAGMLVALIVSSLAGNTDWVLPLAALGYTDGLLGGMARSIAFAENAAPFRRWLRSNPLTSAAIVIGIALLAGKMVGEVGGQVQAVACLMWNLVFGWLVWGCLFIASRSDAD